MGRVSKRVSDEPLTSAQLFEQARVSCPYKEDYHHICERIQLGTKITYDTHHDRLELFNMTLGGDFYQEFTDMEYSYFLEYGWDEGVRWMYNKNNKRKIRDLEMRKKSNVCKTPEQKQRVQEQIEVIKSKLRWQ